MIRKDGICIWIFDIGFGFGFGFGVSVCVSVGVCVWIGVWVGKTRVEGEVEVLGVEGIEIVEGRVLVG